MDNLKPAPIDYLEMNQGTPHPDYLASALQEILNKHSFNADVMGALKVLDFLTERGFKVAAFLQCNSKGEHGNGVAILSAGYSEIYKGFMISLWGTSKNSELVFFVTNNQGEYLRYGTKNTPNFVSTDDAKNYINAYLVSNYA